MNPTHVSPDDALAQTMVINRKLPTVLIALVALTSSSCSTLHWPESALTRVSIPGNTENFANRFYAGAGFGSSSLDPETGGTRFSGKSQNAASSNLKFGYDVHNMLAVELDSAVLGQADLEEGVAAGIKYSALSASALIYGLSGVENRSRRERLSAYGRLGYGYNRRASNVIGLDGSSGGVLVGLGAEYGFANGVGLRAEVVRHDANVTNLGLGLVYRFNSLKRFVPAEFSHGDASSTKVSERNRSGAELAAAAVGSVGQDNYPVDSSLRPLSIRILASAADHDLDGVPNEIDQCRDTEAGTAVTREGCGLFDGTLGNGAFSSGSARLDSTVKASLDTLAGQLAAFPEVRIAIEAHTDDKGPEDINMNVSLSRANMVRDYLVRKGVPEAQLSVFAYGETRPLADNATERGRDINRRIEIRTLPSLDVTEIDVVMVRAKDLSSRLGKATSVDRDEPSLGAAMAAIDLVPAGIQIPGLPIGGIVQGVGFEPDSTTLTDASRPPLVLLAKKLKAFPEARIAIMAHTNYLDTPERNLELSMQQARAVMQVLISEGINRRRIEAEGYGDTLPLAQNLTPADAVVNRRIELRLLK